MLMADAMDDQRTTVQQDEAGVFDDAEGDDSLCPPASKRQRTPAAAGDAAAAATPEPAIADPSPPTDVPGQYRVIELPFPSGPQTLLVYEDPNAGPGGRVWDASVALARHLAANLDISGGEGRSVVEVGAGAGAPGMTVALMGGAVTLTDRPRVEPLMLRNAGLCNQAISCGCGAAKEGQPGSIRVSPPAPPHHNSPGIPRTVLLALSGGHFRVGRGYQAARPAVHRAPRRAALLGKTSSNPHRSLTISRDLLYISDRLLVITAGHRQ